MQHHFARHTRLAGLLLLVAVAVPAGIAVVSFSAYHETAAAATRSEEIRGDIRLLDEVLTMSARMAATTGQGFWIERYEAHVDDLDAAIKAMLDLARTEAAGRMVDTTNEANTALVEMETRSFELVRQGRGRDAYALLTSEEYERQKTIYAAGMTSAMAIVHGEFAAAASRSWSSLLLATLFSAVGVSACFFVWTWLMGKAFRTQESLHHAARAGRDAATLANAAKSMFLANMSHELRTPLNAVIGYSEMLREGAEEDKRAGDIADHDRVIGAARRLLTLINDLLDFSKAEAGKIVLRPKEFDVRSLVETSVATIAPAAAAGGNNTRIEIADDVGAGATDEFRLEQCLLNLLSNAAKFTRDGEISVHASRERSDDADWLVFVVRDTGIGLSPGQLERLFQPFVQAEAAVARTHGGTGLGLAITRQLAHLLGGEVAVESAIGHGSSFTLRVPAVLSGVEQGVARAKRDVPALAA